MKYPNEDSSEHEHQVFLMAWVARAIATGPVAANRWAASLGGLADTEMNLYLTRPVDLRHFLKTHSEASQAQQMPSLKWLFAIPNGGARGGNRKQAIIRGGQLRAEGVKPGVADLMLPVTTRLFAGLFIEMKRPAERPVRAGKGGLSDEQIEFSEFVRQQNYRCVVCYSWTEAAQCIVDYLT